MRIRLGKFGGMVPRRGEQHLNEPYAVEATNVDLDSKALRPLIEPTLEHVFAPGAPDAPDPTRPDPIIPPAGPDGNPDPIVPPPEDCVAPELTPSFVWTDPCGPECSPYSCDTLDTYTGGIGNTFGPPDAEVSDFFPLDTGERTLTLTDEIRWAMVEDDFIDSCNPTTKVLQSTNYIDGAVSSRYLVTPNDPGAWGGTQYLSFFMKDASVDASPLGAAADLMMWYGRVRYTIQRPDLSTFVATQDGMRYGVRMTTTPGSADITFRLYMLDFDDIGSISRTAFTLSLYDGYLEADDWTLVNLTMYHSLSIVEGGKKVVGSWNFAAKVIFVDENGVTQTREGTYTYIGTVATVNQVSGDIIIYTEMDEDPLNPNIDYMYRGMNHRLTHINTTAVDAEELFNAFQRNLVDYEVPAECADCTADGSATFSAPGTGTPPLTYRWFLDGIELQGKVEDTLTLSYNELFPDVLVVSPNIPKSEALVSVLVTNPCGQEQYDWQVFADAD